MKARLYTNCFVYWGPKFKYDSGYFKRYRIKNIVAGMVTRQKYRIFLDLPDPTPKILFLTSKKDKSDF